MPDDPDVSSGLPIAEPSSSIPRPTTSFGSASSNGWIYVMGGYTGRPHDYHREGQSGDFYRINVHDLDHMEMLPNELRVQSAPLEAWNGKIIRTGGMVALNAPGELARLQSLDSVAIFDPETGGWENLPAMPSGRSSHDTAVIGSHLHVIGGWTLDPDADGGSWHADALVLDLENPAAGWSSIPMPFERRALATVAIGDHIAVIGGMASKGGPTSDVELYDLTTGSWSDGPSFPSEAFGVAGDRVDGRIVASSSDGLVYSWAPGEDDWVKVGTMTFPRFFHQMVGDHNGDVITIGGISRGMRPAHLERLHLGSVEPSDAMVRHWVIPTPSAAKNRQGFFVRDGWIYMFGGNNSTGQHDFEAGNFLDEAWKLNLATMTWRRTADYPMRRQSIQSHMADDGLTGFALGGFGHDGTAARTHVEGYTYDFKTDSWSSTGPDLEVSRSQFGLVEQGGRYWVFGGLDYDPRREEGDQFRHKIEVLTAATDGDAGLFEDSGLRLRTPRRAFGGVLVEDKYYMLGGMREDFQLVDDCEAFDFESRSWESIPSPERTRLSPEAVAIGHRIFLAGGMSPKVGSEGLEPNRSLEMFDTRTGAWRTIVEELPFSLRHIRMMPFRSQLLIFTSHESDSNMAHMVLLNPMKMVNESSIAAVN
ncbi:MAG: hypothetical protein MK082_13045 [Phycisphaerales bacterium]|nr:hypothetical protein [Phycisphaerales bacterium]